VIARNLTEFQQLQWWTAEGAAILAERRQRAESLRAEGLSFKQIARQIGGTPDGVRGTLRKMRRREELRAQGLLRPRGRPRKAT